MQSHLPWSTSGQLCAPCRLWTFRRRRPPPWFPPLPLRRFLVSPEVRNNEPLFAQGTFCKASRPDWYLPGQPLCAGFFAAKYPCPLWICCFLVCRPLSRRPAHCSHDHDKDYRTISRQFSRSSLIFGAWISRYTWQHSCKRAVPAWDC